MKALPTLLVTVLSMGLIGMFASAKTPPTPEEIAKKAAEEAAKPIVGTVVKVDGSNIVIKTHGKNAGEVTIPTDAKTQFELNDAPASLDKVKAGYEVAATPKTGIAKKVLIDDLKKPKKTKKDKKK